MLYVYIGCFTFGILYSVVSALLGGHDSGHSGAGHTGLHGDAGSDTADVPSPWNPLVVASAIAAFGATGIIGKIGFHMGDLASSALALTFAGIVGALVFFGVVKLMYSSQSDSTFSLEELTGAEAEVVTPIPCQGMGEIVVIVNGVRYNLPARLEGDKEVSRGKTVVIKEINGNIAVVSRKMTIEEYESLELERNKAKDHLNES